MFGVQLKPEHVEKVSWTAKNVQGNACLGTSFLTFSIEPSAHPDSVSYAWRWRHVWVKEQSGNDKVFLGEQRWTRMFIRSDTSNYPYHPSRRLCAY